VQRVWGEVVTMTSTATAAEQTRTVLITGSTSGIGAATARTLATQGWHVVVTGRDQIRGAAVVADIVGSGGQAVWVPSDLTSPPEALRNFARAATDAAGGRLDAVVHNAALCPAVDTVGLSDIDV
jgi:3-oxoacyl-[acyl-carrier protein] reductase